MSTSAGRVGDDGTALSDDTALSSHRLAGWVHELAGIDDTAHDAELIDRISELERIKSACAAAQAKLTVAFTASRTAGLTATQARDDRVHRSIAAQVALARATPRSAAAGTSAWPRR